MLEIVLLAFFNRKWIDKIPDLVYVQDQSATREVLREMILTRLGKSLSQKKIHASFLLNLSEEAPWIAATRYWSIGYQSL